MAERSYAVRLSARVDQYVAAMNAAKASTASFSKDSQRNLEQLGGQMQSVGGKMTRRVSLPLLGAGVAAGKMAADFDSSLSKITALVGVGADEVAGMRDEVMALAGETAQAPKKLADALFFITSAGLRGSDAMDALQFSAKAAAAGLGNVETIADVVTSAMNAYGPSVLNAEQATDILIGTVREGKAEAPALAASLGTVLPVASALGIKFDEVGATMAAMTRTGTDAATAGTQLNAVMTGLLKPTPQAEEALAGVGLSSQGLRDTLAQPGGLLTVLLALKDRFGDNEAAMAEVFPNVRALRGVLDLLGAQGETNAQIFERMTDTVGLTGQAFSTMADTDAFKAKQAWVDLQVALVDAGEQLLPVATRIFEAVSTVANAFASLPGPAQSVILVLAGIVAAAGPLIWVSGTVIKNLGYISSGFSKLASASTLAKTSLIGIGAVITAAAVVYSEYNRKKQIAKQRTEELTQALKAEREGQQGAVNAALIAQFDDLTDAIEGTGLELVDLVRAAKGEVTPAMREYRDTLLGGVIEHGLLEKAIDQVAESLGEAEKKDAAVAAAVDALSESTGDLTGHTRAYYDYQMRATAAAEEHTSALEEQTRAADGDAAMLGNIPAQLARKARLDAEAQAAAEEHAKALEEQQRILDDLANAMMGAVGGDIALRDAQYDAADAIDAYHEAVAGADVGTREWTEAQDDAARAQIGLAESAADYAADQAAANGELFTAADRAAVMRDELMKVADSLAPDDPLRAQLRAYIAELGQVPTQIATNLTLTVPSWAAGAVRASLNAGGADYTVEGYRASGGDVRRAGFYEVAERGRPELLRSGSRTFLIPGESGYISPAGSMPAASSATSFDSAELTRAIGDAFPSTMVLEVEGRQMTAHVRGVVGDLEREKAGAL